MITDCQDLNAHLSKGVYVSPVNCQGSFWPSWRKNIQSPCPPLPMKRCVKD